MKLNEIVPGYYYLLLFNGVVSTVKVLDVLHRDRTVYHRVTCLVQNPITKRQLLIRDGRKFLRPAGMRLYT